jgi:hypothetical protein
MRDWCDPGTGVRGWRDGAEEGRERYVMREREVARFMGALVVYLASAQLNAGGRGLFRHKRECAC